ncbi:NAD-dependent epimerase/dehydratase family protein [Hoeflea sp. TYP-13]|uniref:NAD-dependent epimerase/dehydratase family protein n=1 Tax=Hoeflea sp. TYP-13 TaxID=3230023 RepID=UPI0034C66B1C
MIPNLRCKHSKELGITITGASGYVGLHLIEAFGSGDFRDVPIEHVPAGSVIIHLAAAVSDTRDALLANLAADTLLLEIANDRHRRIIYASSNNIYPCAIGCRLNELPDCSDYYAASKIFGETLYSNLSKIPVTAVRIADVFGIGQKHGKFFNAIEKSIRTHTPLRQYGKGLKRRSYIHIQELCAFLMFAAQDGFMDSQAHAKINLGYRDSAGVSEILSLVSELTDLPIRVTQLEADASAFDVRTMQATEVSGYTLRWASFRDALKAYVEQIVSDR